MTKTEAKERLRALLADMLRRIEEDSGHLYPRSKERSATAWTWRLQELLPHAAACAEVLGLDPPVEFGVVRSGPWKGVWAVTWQNPWAHVPVPRTEQAIRIHNTWSYAVPTTAPVEDALTRDKIAASLRDTMAFLDSDHVDHEEPPPDSNGRARREARREHERATAAHTRRQRTGHVHRRRAVPVDLRRAVARASPETSLTCKGYPQSSSAPSPPAKADGTSKAHPRHGR